MRVTGLSARFFLACAALVAFACPAAAAEPTDKFDNFRMRQGLPTQLKQVAPDLYFLYDDLSSNSAFLVTDEGVLVIDTRQHPAHGRDLIERIRRITDKPVRWVINTHAHGDHFYGNPAFKAAKGIPLPEVLLAVTIVLVVAGALMILLGWHARWAAAVLFVWLIPVTFLYHDFWAAQPAQVFNQTTHFMKNVAIMGALLHLFGMGPGPLSLRADERAPGTGATA